MKKLLILSGKGGTGKTTLASAFIGLGKIKAYADCDVDAPNLHLLMAQNRQSINRDYYGLDKAGIDQELCIQCGLCMENCRFGAIEFDDEFKVDYFGCEGCGVCEFICPQGAVSLYPAVAGELMLYTNDSIFSTAQLKMGSGNSGLLVTEVKKQMESENIHTDIAIIDGSPGIGCPVIASISGVDMVLIVTEPSISGINDMERIIKTAENFQVKIAICINKYDTNEDKANEIEAFCEEGALPLVGRIPYDNEAVRATNDGKSIIDIDCEAGRATREIFKKTMKILLND